MKLWSALLNYSAKPIRLVGKIGVLIAVISIIILLYGIMIKNEIVLLCSAVFFCTGLIITALGVIGEYIVRMFMIITHEPQYIIRTDTRDANEVVEVEIEIAYSGRR